MKPFTSVKSGKISGQIAQQIKDTILNGVVKPGDRLPPVRRLVEHFEASHISVREALKGLEASGFITMKPGSGVFISELNSQPMGELLSSILRIHKTSMKEVTEARVILEPAIARLACARIASEDLLRLERNFQESFEMAKSRLSTHAKFIEFHSLVAESTHNLVLSLTMKTLLDAMREMALEVADDSAIQTEDAFRVVRYHKRILGALKERNAQKASELMLKDILHTQSSYRKFKSLGE